MLGARKHLIESRRPLDRRDPEPAGEHRGLAADSVPALGLGAPGHAAVRVKNVKFISADLGAARPDKLQCWRGQLRDSDRDSGLRLGVVLALSDDRAFDALGGDLVQADREQESIRIDDVDLLPHTRTERASQMAGVAADDYGPPALTAGKKQRQPTPAAYSSFRRPRAVRPASVSSPPPPSR